MGRIQQADPVFLQSDPASQQKCRADADCPSGNLCHPGQFVCFSVYPTPRMINISFAQPTAMAQCKPVNVYFQFDSADLVEEAQTWLDYNYRCLGARQAKRLVLEAHCDARGDVSYNEALSVRRGMAVKQHLQQLGLTIPIEVHGLGKKEPIKAGQTEQEYAWNRRVEFRFE